MSDLSHVRRRLRTPVTRTSTSHLPSARPIKQSLAHRLIGIFKLSSLRPRFARLVTFLRHVTRTNQPRIKRILAKCRQLLSRLPSLPRTIPRLTRKQWLIVAACGVLVWFTVTRPPVKPSPVKSTEIKPSSQTQVVTGPVKESPPFASLLPTGKNIEELGGWSRISPPDKDPVYAYVDRIGTIQINVSQQQLPRQLESDDDIRQLADSFDAREVIKAGDTTVYIGTSSKGPQSIIFTKNNLLILIKSTNRIAEPLWQNYIKSLK